MKLSTARLKRVTLAAFAGVALAWLWVSAENARITGIGPKPKNGYHMEPVSYVPPPFPGATIVEIPDSSPVGEGPIAFPSSFPGKVSPGVGLSFRGRLHLPEDDAIIGGILVEWFTVDSMKRETPNWVEMAIPVKASPGVWEYSIEQKVRLPPGNYFVRLVFQDLKKEPGRRYVVTRSDVPIQVAGRPQ